ncbi:MAG: ABC transporter permease [Ignavibacteriaceae bacterium]|jgi:peptide/nickel transport system permease protein|nr:ABC transporter permease [Ignavibacteriaceae bacterium]
MKSSALFLSLIKRLTTSVFVLFLTVSFLFVLVRIAPGDPSQKFLSPNLSPQLVERVKSSFQLDKQIHEQYISFLKNALTGDFGVSYSFHRPVNEVIAEVLPFTILFSLSAFILQLIGGLLFAVLAFRYHQKFWDKFLSRGSLFLYAVPSFVSGLFFVYLFSVQLQIFPSSGIKTVGTLENNYFFLLLDYAHHLFLPVLVLSLTGLPVYFKYFRENFEENQNKLFTLYLRANGISERKILFSHLIPNSLNSIIAYAGVDLGILFSGALITEVIFSLPGMGRLAVGAILQRDYPLIIGCTLTAGVLIILTSLLADLIRLKIDKRLIKGLLN